MRVRLMALAAGGVALAVLASGAGAADGWKVVHTAGPIESIALEGTVAAYDVHAVGRVCNRLYAWRLRTGSTSQIGGKATCRADETSTGGGVTRIALDDRRAAWIVNRGGNSETIDELFTSPLVRPAERRRARAVRRGEVAVGLAGDWLGGLVSDGATIFFNRWATTLEDGRQAVVSGSLHRVTGSGLPKTASGTETVVAQAASGARVAVLRADGRVAVHEASGRLLRVIAPTAPGVAVALSGQRLVVLTADRTIELYGAGSGARLRTWQAAGKVSTRIDLEGRVLSYAVGGRVHVLNVVNGKAAVLASHKRKIVDVQIEDGVLYAYNGPSATPGTVVYVPARALSAALR